MKNKIIYPTDREINIQSIICTDNELSFGEIIWSPRIFIAGANWAINEIKNKNNSNNSNINELKVKELHNINIAANIHIDTYITNITELLRQRQEIALALLQTSDDNYKKLLEVYNYINENIKLLIGL